MRFPFLRRARAAPAPSATTGADSGTVSGAPGTTKARGDAAEDAALAHLQAAGLRLLGRRLKTPGRGGGEIDLLMCERDGTWVFVEVRQRSSAAFGGAAASIGATKRRRIVLAAQHLVARKHPQPACRFDVVLVEPAGLRWLRGAFTADEA